MNSTYKKNITKPAQYGGHFSEHSISHIDKKPLTLWKGDGKCRFFFSICKVLWEYNLRNIQDEGKLKLQVLDLYCCSRILMAKIQRQQTLKCILLYTIAVFYIEPLLVQHLANQIMWHHWTFNVMPNFSPF